MQSIDTFDAQVTYSKSLAPRALPSFVLSESNLGVGASLGNSALWITTKGTGAIEKVFLNEVGESLLGAMSTRYGPHARPLVGVGVATQTYTALSPQPGTRTFEIHPAYQRVRCQLSSIVEIEETTFLPLGPLENGAEDPALVYVQIEIYNRDNASHHYRAIGSALLRGSTAPDVRARYDDGIHALVACNVSRPELVRIVGLSEAPTRYGSDFDVGSTYDTGHMHALNNTTNAQGDIIGRLQLDLVLKPHERRKFCFTVGLYTKGEADALQRYRQKPDAQAALDRSVEYLEDVLQQGRVLTPDPVINHGALWSKVNMRRVMAAYPTGRAFTNDPGTYANVVVRDAAWFVYGNDHFLPSFSRSLLDNITSRQYPSGKLPEYFDAVTQHVEDDGLNINDDTPLYILAVNHHFRSTGDVAWLEATYPAVAKAARCIIAQMDKRGLVFCTAKDPRGDVWAIAGWRNIIPGYTINGAVTEVNAECVAALRAAAHLADNLGGREQDKNDFSQASARIKAAMKRYLINPNNGKYYLNVDVDGNAHTDVTGDEIFPVIMRAHDDEDTGFRIISRLNYPDFWTSAGLRTVSRMDPRYDPKAYSGLLGGMWPGLTWWYAFGAVRYHPELMVRALRSSFEHYGAAPKRYNTVPGQFSEWFDGESLVNCGMRLSPWEPPRFLWAAIEGVCGVMLMPGAPHIKPVIPPNWSWIGLRNLPYHGALLSYFVVREGEAGFRVYSTMKLESDYEVELFDGDVSDDVQVFGESAVVIALRREGAAAILVGNTADVTVQTPVTIQPLRRMPARFNIRTYNSERGDWEPSRVLAISQLAEVSLSIEAGGFRVIELTRADT